MWIKNNYCLQYNSSHLVRLNVDVCLSGYFYSVSDILSTNKSLHFTL